MTTRYFICRETEMKKSKVIFALLALGMLLTLCACSSRSFSADCGFVPVEGYIAMAMDEREGIVMSLEFYGNANDVKLLENAADISFHNIDGLVVIKGGSVTPLEPKDGYERCRLDVYMTPDKPGKAVCTQLSIRLPHVESRVFPDIGSISFQVDETSLSDPAIDVSDSPTQADRSRLPYKYTILGEVIADGIGPRLKSIQYSAEHRIVFSEALGGQKQINGEIGLTGDTVKIIRPRLVMSSFMDNDIATHGPVCYCK